MSPNSFSAYLLIWPVTVYCVLTAFGRLLNENYVSFMRALIAAQDSSHPDYKVSD